MLISLFLYPFVFPLLLLLPFFGFVPPPDGPLFLSPLSSLSLHHKLAIDPDLSENSMIDEGSYNLPSVSLVN